MLVPSLIAFASCLRAAEFDVRAFGAKGDGKTVDSPAINKAIEDAAARGGGTVCFPAGTYASYSIHLRSNVALHFESGATLLALETRASAAGGGSAARDPGENAGAPSGYDPPEPNTGLDQYQDFGHNHWHNSLIWGEDLHDIAITGPGRIDGFGLSKGNASVQRDQTAAERVAGIKAPPAASRVDPASIKSGPFGLPSPRDTLPPGIGNKAIALKNCRNVTIRDFTILHGGHFAILATGVDNLTISNLTIDTNRDGMDIVSCRNVSLSDCCVNSPLDDAIVFKSDYSLGFARPCENITVTNCHVSGFQEGSFIDGTYVRRRRPDGTLLDTTGRIKFGTESNGGFRNVAVSNCTFDCCQGLAIEEVDGGSLEDVNISNLVMRDITNAAIYVRLGSRNRAPEGTKTGSLRRVSISNVDIYNVDPRLSSIISGISGHPIEDLTLSNIRIVYRGGGTAEQAAIEPPEIETAYPEPSRHGTMPAYGFFIRHVKGLVMRDIDVRTLTPDARPPFVLEDVSDAHFDHVKAPHAEGVPVFVKRDVSNLDLRDTPGSP
jgi:polygalacturonase